MTLPKYVLGSIQVPEQVDKSRQIEFFQKVILKFENLFVLGSYEYAERQN